MEVGCKRNEPFEEAIDDKYGIDVDDVFEIADILDVKFKAEFSLVLKKTPLPVEDELHIGYLKLDKIKV